MSTDYRQRTRRAIATRDIASLQITHPADTVSGGALVMIIRADVKADDHIRSNANPVPIARISMSLPICRSGR